MRIYSVFGKKFSSYGRIINDEFNDILNVLNNTECSNEVVYKASDANLEKTKSFKIIANDYFGGMPIQLGYCNGVNNKLNCLEYHLDSEINYSSEEFILLLGLRSQIKNNTFNTKNVVAFRVPANTPIEVFATTLHYAPCRENNEKFRVLVALPKGTNTKDARSKKEPLLFMQNKWLLAHKDSPEASKGASIGLIGKNIEI